VAIRRHKAQLFVLLLALAIGLSAIGGEVDPKTFITHIDRLPNYLTDITPHLSLRNLPSDLADWYWNLGHWFDLLVDTLLMAYLGTAFGVLGGFCLSFFAAANLTPHGSVRLVARRFLEICRTIPDLVFALVFVAAFGLGATPGILALSIHTSGALGKLFAEVVENIDMSGVDALKATGATWTQTIRFGVLPQVAANFVSYALLRFEINVRAAAVIGFVGAGGIGFDLIEAIRKFYYSDVSAILLMIIATVVLIDLGSERLRHALTKAERRG